LNLLERRSAALAALTGWAAFVSAVLATVPAAACSKTQVAKGAPEAAAATKFDWPVSGRIETQCWTEATDAINIAAEDGATVRAAQSGEVAYAGPLKRYGKVIMMRHAGGFVSATYGDIGDLRVKRADHIERGQPIAVIRPAEDYSGTGLKFELRLGPKAVDARRFMSAPEPPPERGAGSLSTE